MVRHLIFLATLTTSLATYTSALAGPECTCRFKGQDIPEGQMICMNLPSGDVLAQCGRVLNNTAWKTIKKGCPFSATTLRAGRNKAT